MAIKIKPSVLDNVKMSYAMESASRIRIDCAEGINNLLASEKVAQALRECSAEMLADYPHRGVLEQALMDYWAGYPVTPEMFLLGNGSQKLIFLVNKLLIERRRRVLGYVPQYSSYCSDILFCGGDYRAVRLSGDYRFNADALIAAMTPEDTLVYIDNPNNPTGQVITLSDVEKVVRRAQELGVCVLVDEAYGDYMPQSASAIGLLGAYDNLIVTRTFSKGFGLAGLRLGYLVTSAATVREMKKLMTPYDGNTLARHIAAAVLEDTDFLPQLRQQVAALKRPLLEQPFARLRIAHTDPHVPIMMIYHPDADFDLAAALAERGIGAVSGKGFYYMNGNMVRLRVPRAEELDDVIAALRAIDTDSNE